MRNRIFAIATALIILIIMTTGMVSAEETSMKELGNGLYVSGSENVDWTYTKNTETAYAELKILKDDVIITGTAKINTHIVIGDSNLPSDSKSTDASAPVKNLTIRDLKKNDDNIELNIKKFVVDEPFVLNVQGKNNNLTHFYNEGITAQADRLIIQGQDRDSSSIYIENTTLSNINLDIKDISFSSNGYLMIGNVEKNEIVTKRSIHIYNSNIALASWMAATEKITVEDSTIKASQIKSINIDFIGNIQADFKFPDNTGNEGSSIAIAANEDVKFALTGEGSYVAATGKKNTAGVSTTAGIFARKIILNDNNVIEEGGKIIIREEGDLESIGTDEKTPAEYIKIVYKPSEEPAPTVNPSPATGDYSNMLIPIALTLFAAAAGTTALLRRRVQ